MRTHALVTLDRPYLDIVDHARTLEKFSDKAQGGSNKHIRAEEELGGFQSGFKVPSDRPLRRDQQG